MFIILSYFLIMPANATSKAGSAKDFMKEFHDKQKELYEKRKYLDDREQRTAADMNKAISDYEKKPSAELVQKIENLKSLIINNLQEQIINDRNYINYMEKDLFKVWEDKENFEKSLEQAKKERDEYKSLAEEAQKQAAKKDPQIKFEEYVSQIRQDADKMMQDVAPARSVKK